MAHRRYTTHSAQTGNVAHAHFNTIEDAMTYCDQYEPKPNESSSRELQEGFNVTQDWAEHSAIARRGYVEGEKTLRKERSNAHISAPAPSAEVFDMVYDVCGDGVDMGRYLEGVPECMTDYREILADTAGRVLTLVFTGTYSGHINAKHAAQYGIGLAVIVEALEANGYAVNLVASYCGMYRDKTLKKAMGGTADYCITVPVKSSAEPLDISRLVRTTVYVDFFRRTIFRVKERLTFDLTGKTLNHFDLGYGMPKSAKENTPADFKADAILSPLETPQSAKDWVSQFAYEIKKQTGIQIKS